MTIDSVRQMVVAAMNARFGNPSALDGVGNLIYTSAISGVGASNVGVAGSAAISVIEVKTIATIT